MNIEHVVIKPILTEKSTNLTKNNVYTFEVALKANKHSVASALEKVYKVKVGTVRMLQRMGKMKKAGKMMRLKKLPDTKIAYVTLTEGKIDLFPQS
ncbi:MAG: hypothetical protein RI947_336 [Candidatus Parcubacteria bacterium]|jgi:large subunit ribosomal protein L23